MKSFLKSLVTIFCLILTFGTASAVTYTIKTNAPKTYTNTSSNYQNYGTSYSDNMPTKANPTVEAVLNPALQSPQAQCKKPIFEQNKKDLHPQNGSYKHVDIQDLTTEKFYQNGLFVHETISGLLKKDAVREKKYIYDSHNNLIETQEIYKNGKIEKSKNEYQYDANGNILEKKVYDNNGQLDHRDIYKYDLKNREIFSKHITDNTEEVMEYEYLSDDSKIAKRYYKNPIEKTPRFVQEFKKDKYGNTLYNKSINNYGSWDTSKYEYKYDNCGRVLENKAYSTYIVNEYNPNNELRLRSYTIYAYDENGDLISEQNVIIRSNSCNLTKYKYKQNYIEAIHQNCNSDNSTKDKSFMTIYDYQGNKIGIGCDMNAKSCIEKYEYGPYNNVIKRCWFDKQLKDYKCYSIK